MKRVINYDRPRKITTKISVVIPVCNEAFTVKKTLDDLIKLFKFFPKGSELIVDDASNDGTEKILRNYQKKNKFIKIYFHKRPNGFANAVKNLLDKAKNKMIFFLDADNQFYVEDFWRLYSFANKFDIVKGVKIGRKDPLIRKLISRIFANLVNLIFNIRINDLNTGFYIINKETIINILPKVRFMPLLINSEIMINCICNNFTYKQVFVRHRVREMGNSRAIQNAVSFIKHIFLAVTGLIKIKSNLN